MVLSRWTGLALGVALTVAAPGAIAGKKKRKKKTQPKAPVSFKIENTCSTDLTISVGSAAVAVKTGETSAEQIIEVGEDFSFPVKITAPATLDLGLLQFNAGGKYSVRFAACDAGGANLLTTDLSERPKSLSPNAAAKVRFRARQNGHLEYRSDTQRRNKMLSVAMTDYKDTPAGPFKFQFRLRAARKGPIVKMLKDTVKVAPAKRYLIESNVSGTSIYYKIEDEGWVGTKQ